MRISPCPIIEAIIQINCTFTVDQDVAVGLIFSLLQKEKGLSELNLEKLPILNLPEDIRTSDPNLRDKAWYRINSGDCFILIGLFGVALGVNPPYNGWDMFRKFAEKVFSVLKGDVIKEISSISLKYLNFFKEINIFEKINCEVCLNGQKITSVPTIFRTEIPDGKFVKILQITNGAHLQNKAIGIDHDGFIIEIAFFTRDASIDTFDKVIDEAHSNEEKLFFDLLSSDFIKMFEIDYE